MKKLIPFIFILAVFAGSCKPKNTLPDIEELDVTYMMPGVQWAVIESPYVAFRAEPSYEGEVLSHGRRGDISKLIGKRSVLNTLLEKKVPVQWYKLESGWIEARDIKIYENKFKAETASGKMKKGS